MKIKTFILTFLMMMSCSILFGQELLTGEAKTESKLKQFLFNEDYGTITIGDDFSVSSTIEIPKGRKITIDLNGHKLTTNADIYIFKNFGRLTITDNSTDGKGTISSLGIYNGKPQTRTNTDDIDYTAQLTIKGGVFENISPYGGAAIYNHLGVIDIQGGEFYGEYSAITNFGLATIANAYIECLNRDNGAAAIINDFEIEYGNNVNVVGIYTAYNNSETASITDGEATYLFAELKGTKTKYPSLQAALDACTTGDNTINLLFHNSDNATVSQEEGVNITIDGNGYKDKQFEYTGTIYVNGNSRHTGTETLTIQDVNFVTTDNEHDFISCNSGSDPVIRYAHNVTVQRCNFTATEGSTAVVALRFRQSYNINVVNSEFTNLHSAMWATGTSGIAFDNITATNCKEGGISVGTSTPVSVNKFIMEGEGAPQYGVRADGSGAYSLTVENSTLSAEVPVIVRNTTGEYNLTVAEDVTLTATNGGPQVVVTKGSDDVPYVAPTVKVNVTLNNDASTFGLTAKIGNTYYSTLDEAFAVATEDQTIVLLADATPSLTSQRAITKAAVIDLGGKTLTLTEDDLYFGTTTFQNGNIVVDPSVKASTAVFWMFENQTLTFDNVKLTATGVTGTYLIGINGGTGSNVNLLNGTNIIINNESQAALSAVICDNGTGNNVIIKDSYINVNKIEGRFYLGGISGNITVDNTDIDLNGVKEGFYLRANQTLSIEGESEVEVVLNDTNNRYGINITDYSATYTKDDLATVNATVYDPVVRVKNLTELQTALVENVDKPIFATETIVISEGTLELDLNTRRVFAADKNVIKNDGATLTIKNGTIERVGDVVGYAFNNAQGTLNITGTTIKGGLYTSGTSLVATNANISHFQSTRHAIYAYDCNVTLNGGTYHNDNSGNATIMAAGSSVVTIKDGTFSIKDGRQELGWTSCLTDTQNTASITVEGGTFNGGFRVQTGTTMTIEGGSFNDCYGSNYNIYGTAVVKGGTFTDANAINFAKGNLAEGYVASDNGNGTFTVLKGVAKIGDTYYATLQEAIDAAEDGTTTINILADITGDVTILQQEGINIVIDGKKNDTENYTFNGTINIYGNARNTGTETLKIQNVNFYTKDNARYFIEANEYGQISETNNFKQYAHNVTVMNCNFSAENTENTVVGMRFRQAYNVSAVNCTSDGIFSIMWTTAVDGLTLNGVEATNCEEGITIGGASKEVEIIGTIINSETYAIRAEGAGSDFTIENSTLEAKVPVVVRNVTDNSMISFTFDGTNTITKDNPAGYWFVAGKTEYKGGENEQLPETAGQISVTLNDTDLDREGIYGSALNGEGTEENPYLIETVNDLVFFREKVNGGNNYAGKHVKLAANIDLNNKEWTPIGNVTYDSKYKPADASKVFSGVFNGNGKVISNLKVASTVGGADTQANVGLFGITGEGAVIKDLTLTNVNIETDGRNVGALAGFAYKATLSNITVNGNIQIKGGNNVSGVAGMTRYYDMSATNIKVVGNDGSAIVGNNIVGGIFAEIAPNGSVQTFENLSVENVAINGVGGVGGIVGLLTLGTVENVSVKNVALTGRTDYQGDAMGRIRLGSVAGLMGDKYATIANVTTENVTAKNLDGNAVVLPIIGANYDASSNATEAKIGDTYYATLKIAINASQDNDEIVLLDNVTDVDPTISKKVTLNLNEKTITDAYIIITSEVNIKGGSIKNVNEPYPLVVQNGGKLTVDGVGIEASKSDRAIWVREGSELVFNNSSILATKGEGNNKTNLIAAIYTDSNTDVTINSGTITVDTPDNKAVAIFGNYKNANVTVNGGKISTSGKNYSYGINVDGDITVTGGEIVTNEKGYAYSSGIRYGYNYALVTATGNVTITGGSITTNGHSGYAVNVGRIYSSNDQTVSITGGTFTNNLSEVEMTTGNHNAPVLVWTGTASTVTATIENGNFSGYSANLFRKDNGDGNSTLEVSGGTFDREINGEYLAKGYAITANENGTYGVSLASYVVLPEGVTAENYKEKFGDNTVTDGTNYYATMTAALNAVYGTETTLYCKPGANVGQMTHGAIKETLTVYGNDAYTSGNGDFDIGNCNYEGKEITSDITLTVKHLDGCGAWGYKNTEHTINIVFENCKDMSEVYLSGTAGRTNITMTNCEFTDNVDGGNCKVYSNADGTITLKDMLFSGVDKAVNFNHKATGTQTIALENCTFTNCGDDVAGDEIPVRVLSSVAGGNSVLTVTDCTFSGTPEGGADILLDYGVGLTEATVSNTAAKVVVEKENNVGETTIVAANETKSFVNLVPVAKIGDAVYYTFEDAIAAAVADASITSIEILRDYTQTYYIEAGKIYSILENQNLTVVAPEGKSYTITLDRTAGETFSIYHKSAKSSLTIAENVTIEGLQILANGFATSENNTTINGTLKALSLKQWTSNGTITVSETGKVWLGYGDGQFDLAYGNGAVVINGNGDKTEAQFKAGYSCTRGNGNTLTLNNTYFEAGAWFNLDGTNGIVNINNSLLKVSGGDAAGSMTIKAGNEVYVNEGGTLECANITLEEGAKIVVNGGTLKAKTVTNNGTVVVSGTGASTLFIENFSGNAIELRNGTLVDSHIAGAVNAFGTNNFTGETNIEGILSVGYNGSPAEQVVVNITGNFNGGNVLIGNSNEHVLNLGNAEGNRTTAHFGQLGAFGDVNIVNADVTYGYTFIRNEFNVTNSTMAINGGTDTYFSGNAKVVIDNSSWDLCGYANIGSYGYPESKGNADVTLKNGSSMKAINLGVEQYDGKTVILTLEDNSTLTATNLSNTGSIVLAGEEAKITSNELTGTNNVPTTNIEDHKVVYENGAYVVTAKHYVAKIGDEQFESLQEAFDAAENHATIELFNDNVAVIPMNASLYGKNVTITGTAIVDWAGWLFVGRGGEGDAELTFSNANLTSNGVSEGLNVSCAKRNDATVCNGKVTIINSTINLPEFVNRNIVVVENSTINTTHVTSGGRPASETTDGEVAAEFTLTNSKLNAVGNITNGYEGIGIMNVDANSNVNVDELTVTATGTLNSAGNITGAIVKVEEGTIQLTGGIYTTEPQDGWCAENYGVFPYDETSWVVREVYGEQTFELIAGWNWVSSYITEFNDEGLAMLTNNLDQYENGNGNGKQIKNNKASLTYSGSYYVWSGTLSAVSVKEMYKINVVAGQTFTYNGSYVNYDLCEIPLYKGWNYIGYPVNEEMPLADALANLDAKEGDMIKAQNGTAIYTKEGWLSFDLTTLFPGEGYMYENTSDQIKVLRYTTKKSSATTETNNRSSKYWTVDATQYSSNMTMIAMTDVEGGNYEVAAFVNGEVRGSSRPVYVESLDAYILILTISGDDVEEMTFRYYDITTGEEVEFSNRMNYSSDAVVGSIAEPYVLTRGTTGIGEAEMSQVNIYPNPTTTGTEINLQATCDKVEVFNALGAKVAEYQNVDSIDALETAGIYVIRITNDSNVQNCKLVVR